MLILLEDGMVISCALTPRTIASRIDATPNEGETDYENHSSERETTDTK